MGKWTLNYHDDVLHAKVKNLVSGAIARSSLEKADPTISYEHFVNDLDTGDSFTTSLIDILVKELAERRTRPSANDRRLIADRSAKSLRLLATPLRVYRDRSMGRFHPSRRSTNLTEYITSPSSEMDMEEDEDIFERMLDNGNGTLEGVRMNSELFDAYSNHSLPTGPEANTSPTDETSSILLQNIPQGRSGPWSMPPAANLIIPGADLVRQPSIRRPVRSRTVDFNDFTHRRRSSIRDAMGSRAGVSEFPEAREGSWNRTSQSTRRFFPFSRTRRHESADTYSWSDFTDTPSSDALDDDRLTYPSPSSPAWFSLTPPTQASTSAQEVHDAETSDERAYVTGPRLRRRLRAESILSRHALPTIVNPHTISPAHEYSSRSSGDASAYPTPGSTDSETAT